MAQLYLDSAQYPQALKERKQLHQRIAGQYGERDLSMQLPSQTQARLRRAERELELRKTSRRLEQMLSRA